MIEYQLSDFAKIIKFWVIDDTPLVTNLLLLVKDKNIGFYEYIGT